MAIKQEIIDELLANYRNRDDLLGDDGIFKCRHSDQMISFLSHGQQCGQSNNVKRFGKSCLRHGINKR